MRPPAVAFLALWGLVLEIRRPGSVLWWIAVSASSFGGGAGIAWLVSR